MNSQREDVVLNALPMNREQLQRTVLNVNLHVPNLKLGTDTTQPNAKRLKELTTIASDLIEEVWGPGYQFNVQQDTVFPDGAGSHYVNIRVEFRAINLN
ncbi:hypothetical protein Q4E40_02580 [Pontibacter sp. BT731]|uniref:hypothetical protein n=1 Tax=Pontibacter coccineus TaxID=3063328 RepID=UPI0026E23BC5|nr:hypothetical protein [Pontibacter sp. BT731]MDO6388998.1 hypothetical protein [Pontibacter sp. BT731]